jgi:hypothetical protein
MGGNGEGMINYLETICTKLGVKKNFKGSFDSRTYLLFYTKEDIVGSYRHKTGTC